jgi:endonuclease YncB( thermonuclease family)
MKFRLLFIAFCVGAARIPEAAAQQRANWVHLDAVSLVADPANDGDSFHARRNRSGYIFRLYFVDAPETDERFPERLKEQAEYFGVTVPQLLEGGKMASTFTRDRLAQASFEAYTKYRDALGASEDRRVFAMVETNGRWLCELLVENGLARIYGAGDDMPDGVAQRRHWSRLRTLENTARREQRGLWGIGARKGSFRLDSSAGDADTVTKPDVPEARPNSW